MGMFGLGARLPLGTTGAFLHFDFHFQSLGEIGRLGKGWNCLAPRSPGENQKARGI